MMPEPPKTLVMVRDWAHKATQATIDATVQCPGATVDAVKFGWDTTVGCGCLAPLMHDYLIENPDGTVQGCCACAYIRAFDEDPCFLPFGIVLPPSFIGTTMYALSPVGRVAAWVWSVSIFALMKSKFDALKESPALHEDQVAYQKRKQQRDKEYNDRVAFESFRTQEESNKIRRENARLRKKFEASRNQGQ